MTEDDKELLTADERADVLNAINDTLDELGFDLMREYILSEYDMTHGDYEVALGELIRCKDCYWCDEDGTCVRYSFLTKPTDYCSNAERKD